MPMDRCTRRKRPTSGEVINPDQVTPVGSVYNDVIMSVTWLSSCSRSVPAFQDRELDHVHRHTPRARLAVKQTAKLSSELPSRDAIEQEVHRIVEKSYNLERFVVRQQTAM